MAVADLGSNPIIKLSIGTKIPPPPTPPTLPKAAPKNPTRVPNTTCQLNSNSWEINIRDVVVVAVVIFKGREKREHLRARHDDSLFGQIPSGHFPAFENLT